MRGSTWFYRVEASVYPTRRDAVVARHLRPLGGCLAAAGRAGTHRKSWKHDTPLGILCRGRSAAATRHSMERMGRHVAGVFRTDFHIAIGWGWTPPTTLWPSVLGSVLAISLAIVAVSGSRLKQPFLASLAFACLVATALAFWSVRHLRGPIFDNQIFWISALGLVSAALSITAVVSKIETRFIQGRWSPALRIVPLCAIILVGATTLLSLVDGTRRDGGKLDDEPQAVQVLTRQTLDVLPTVGGHKPIVRVDPAIWGVAAGVVLQLVKNSVPVAADELADFFGPPLYPTGSEDTILFISGPDRHKQLAENFPITSIGAFRGSWFVDAIGIREYGDQKR